MPVTVSDVVLGGGSGFLHYLQLASHDDSRNFMFAQSISNYQIGELLNLEHWQFKNLNTETNMSAIVSRVLSRDWTILRKVSVEFPISYYSGYRKSNSMPPERLLVLEKYDCITSFLKDLLWLPIRKRKSSRPWFWFQNACKDVLLCTWWNC